MWRAFVVLVWCRIYLSDIPCKNYNYIFVFVKVMLETLFVPLFLGTVYIPPEAKTENFKETTAVVWMPKEKRQEFILYIVSVSCCCCCCYNCQGYSRCYRRRYLSSVQTEAAAMVAISLRCDQTETRPLTGPLSASENYRPASKWSLAGRLLLIRDAIYHSVCQSPMCTVKYSAQSSSLAALRELCTVPSPDLVHLLLKSKSTDNINSSQLQTLNSTVQLTEQQQCPWLLSLSP